MHCMRNAISSKEVVQDGTWRIRKCAGALTLAAAFAVVGLVTISVGGSCSECAFNCTLAVLKKIASTSVRTKKKTRCNNGTKHKFETSPCGQKSIRTSSVVLGIIQQIRIRILSSWTLIPSNNSIFFFARSGFDDVQRDCTCACAVACFHTCVDQMQTHSRQTHKQHTQHRHITLPFQLWLRR